MIPQRPIKEPDPLSKSTDTVTLKHPPLIGGEKENLLRTVQNENILYYIEFYKIPLLNASSQTPAKWEGYC